VDIAVRVLCVGDDKTLLQTRKLVLAQQFSVETADALSELTISAQGESIALVVLCHSLSREQRYLAAQIVKETWPQAKILEVLASRENQAASANSEVILGLDGPVALLEKAATLLAGPLWPSEPIGLVEKRGVAPPR
jgi:hypothetical protein